jgi:hypothetical protein
VSHSFLVLSLLFLIPGAVVFALRRDLRRVIAVVAPCSIPFAFTERLFYPSYWEPDFLFDLARRIGFGVEDVIFVVGLGAFTSTVYPFFTGARLRALEPGVRSGAGALARRIAPILAVTFALTAVLALARVPMIYGAPAIMLAAGGVIGLLRRDLLVPSLVGGLLAMLVYTALCLAFAALIPGIFALAWHTDRFLDRYLLGIPVEELLYGFASGVAATAFYPYVARQRFTRRGDHELRDGAAP